MDQKTFSALLERYLNGDISQEEASRLLDSLEDPAMRQQWEEAVTALLGNKALHGLSDPARMEAAYQSILAGEAVRLVPSRYARFRKLLPYAAAAVLIACIITGLLYFLRPAPPNAQTSTSTAMAGITPGGNKAVLTLADGSRITLDSTGNGALASQGNVQVIKLDSGRLAYKAAGGTTAGEASYNTLATPRGGQFMITLSDGSKVWLNASSSLRFPTAFNGTTREVQLTGEAYFEIAKNARMPFRVKVNDMTVHVLGTHFNIMAYPDESSIQTTLLEGAVQVRNGSGTVQLKPGQQAQLSATGQMTVNEAVDIEEVIAWKNGYFHFNHESLEGVMRQICRWYNVEAAYEGRIPHREFGGRIERNSSITDVLKILELSNVHYRAQGRKIILTP